LYFLIGPHFSGNLCDYDIEIGSSYHCPIVNITSTSIRCRIGSLSMLDPRIKHNVRVNRYRQGYLSCENQIQFQFLPSISNISPSIGK